MIRSRGKLPMSHPDPQLAQWMAYAAASAVSTILFMTFGMSGWRWVNRAANRVAAISALATVLCSAAAVSAIMRRDAATVNAQPQAIEWCKQVSCSLENAAPVPSHRQEQHPRRPKSAGTLAEGQRPATY